MKNKVSKISEKNKKNQVSENEILIKQQAERIAELKSQIVHLEESLETYRKRERDVIDTLDFARKKGDEYVSMVKVKYALECERIKRFKSRLEKFRTRDELVKCYDTAFGELNAWLDEMERTIVNDFGAPMNDYLSERKRLGEEPSLNYKAISDDSKSSLENADRLTEEELKDLLEQL